MNQTIIIPRSTKPSDQEKSESPANISFVFELPPSTNKLYVRTRGGGQALTKTAKVFREQVKKEVMRTFHNWHAWFKHGVSISSDAIYHVSIKCFFKELENKGWFKLLKSGERAAKTRYKRLDVDNRVKFLTDCVTHSIGIPDDSQIFASSQEKHEDPDNPRAEVTISVLDGAQFFQE